MYMYTYYHTIHAYIIHDVCIIHVDKHWARCNLRELPAACAK